MMGGVSLGQAQGMLADLCPYELAAINECSRRLLQPLGNQVAGLWLFGSKARRDFDADSDLDLLIIVDGADSEIRDRIHLLAARVSYEYDVLINTHILSRERWAELSHYQGTLWREVQRDGVALRMNSQLRESQKVREPEDIHL